MLNFIGLGIGALLGGVWAWRRDGSRLDMAHYAAVLGILGFLGGTIVMLALPAPG